jgi:hypothetical protein
LAEGTVTREEVKELEKQMGVPIKEMVKLMELGGVKKNVPQFAELMEVFQKLAAIK